MIENIEEEVAKFRLDLYIQAVADGKMKINTVREVYGYPPIIGGDIRYKMTPTGAVPLDQLSLYFDMTEEEIEYNETR